MRHREKNSITRHSEIMNTKEARTILSEVMREYQVKEYSYWENAIPESPLVFEKTGASGVDYQIEIEVLWDGRDSRVIRVIFSIDDGGLRAFVPMTDDFLISPEEKSVC
jgi:hypothetical protein